MSLRLNIRPLTFRDLNILISSILTVLTIGLALAYLYENNMFALHSFKDRTIGIAVFAGVNTSLRTDLYIGLILASILIFFIYFLVIQFLYGKFRKSPRQPDGTNPPGPEPSPTLENGIIYLSLFALALLIIVAFTGSERFAFSLKVALFFLFMALVVAAVRHIINTRHIAKLKGLLDNDYIIVYFFILPYVLILAYWVIFNQSFVFTDSYFILYFILCALLFIAYYFLIKYFGDSTAGKLRLDGTILISGIPIMLIPLSIPLSNELQYTLSRTWHVQPAELSAMVILALTVVSIAIAFLYRSRQLTLNSRAVLANSYYPLILSSILLFNLYQPFMVVGNYDMFHTGESLITNQQLFLFNSIPFVNIYPTHGISDSSFQFLYSIFNGYKPVEPLLWYWIPDIIGVILLYF